MRISCCPNAKSDSLAKRFLSEAQATFDRYLPRIAQSLAQLTDEEIWWRPNAASNSVGNIVLHLSGNIRQWIISGFGGVPDIRERDKEFSAQRRHSQRRQTRCAVCAPRSAKPVAFSVANYPPERSTRRYTIQGYHVTGLHAISNVCEHF